MNRIIDISQDGLHLSRHRGFMIVSRDKAELGRVALDDIGAVIIHAHGVTYSNSLITALTEHKAIIVLCGSNHFPMACISAINGHHAQAGRIADQISASLPLKKQLWRHITVQKIKMQAAVLRAFDLPAARLDMMARNVKSGDPANVEAQAARHYWPLVMGNDFLRDRNKQGINALLNYGYTVLRAGVARAVIAAGLHPSIGVHHKSRVNAFALADDLIEPFRPLVDYLVKSLSDNGVSDVDPNAKRALARVLDFDMTLDDTRSPVTTALKTLCGSLVGSYAAGKANLSFATPPSPIEFAALRNANGVS